MGRFVLLAVAVAWGCALGACGQASGDDHPTGESPLLVDTSGRVRPPDLKKAVSDPDELVRSLRLPFRDTARKLGSLEFHGQHKLRVVENGKEVEALDENTAIELAASGDLHAVYANSRSYGRELYAAADTVWIRPRWGKFHKRAPVTPDEPLRVADETFATLAADLELVAFSLKVADGGPAEVAGRKGKRILLALGSPRKRTPQKDPSRKWRDAVTVQALAGEVVLDEATGTLLAGQLGIKVSFQQNGRALEMALESRHAIDKAGTAVTVTPPPDGESVPTPLRSQEFEERQDLLEGIAPPAPRAPVPGGKEQGR